MATMQPEQAAFLLQYHLPSLKNEHRTTSGVIAAIPASHADYRPDPQSKTAVELAWHIAATEHRLYNGITVGAFDFTPVPRPGSELTVANVSEWYADSFAKNFESLSRMTPDQLLKIVDFRGMFQYPAVNFIDFSLRHTIHHRGQLSTYLRAMGGKVPAIYGESYDSAESKKAAQAG
jgi:uncharacterized damage-inducible protein DinB